jgi:two-component system chemotaxis response regulator CheY
MNRRDARVLVIDSEPASRLATHHALRALDCRLVEEASTAAEALEVVRASTFALVLTEWTLPDATAVSLLRALRAEPRMRLLPVVVCARITRQLVSELADVGLSGFLPRPFSLDALDTTLSIFVGRRGPTSAAARADCAN